LVGKNDEINYIDEKHVPSDKTRQWANVSVGRNEINTYTGNVMLVNTGRNTPAKETSFDYKKPCASMIRKREKQHFFFEMLFH